jgi:hypothetical protein
METETEVKTEMPAELPKSAADCRTLGVWRTLVLGKSQREIAEAARVKPARISEIELGKVMPRRKHWAGLIAAFEFTGDDGPEHFYRMVQNARIDRNRAEALRKPISETEPLIAAARRAGLDVSTNVDAPSGTIVVAHEERRAIG